MARPLSSQLKHPPGFSNYRGTAMEDPMNRQTREYDLGELIDNPGLGLALEYDGADRGLLALLLDRVRRRDERPSSERIEPPFAG
jgi:hypothetical protein